MKTAKAMLVGAVVACALFGVCAAYNLTHQPERVLVKATAGAGATLWQLVSREMDKAGDKRDIREVLYETVKLNELKSPNLLDVGDVIIIPLEVQK